MARSPSHSRRQFLGKAGQVMTAAGLVSTLPLLARAQAKPMTVGFIYTGVRQDYGWNQAFAVAARQIGKLDGVKIIEQENVPETAEVEKVMESMIRLDGARVLFPTSFGFWPFILKTAPKFPEVLFVHAGALWKEGDPRTRSATGATWRSRTISAA